MHLNETSPGNRVIALRVMDTKTSERLKLQNQMQNQLYSALQRNEFFLNFQPQVDLRTGFIVGVEALLRWRSPQYGLVSPHQFIPFSEATGLICPIGSWVLRTACTQAKAWQLAGLPTLTMAVNISARQFQQTNLVREITQILEEVELDPSCLAVEITESFAIYDSKFMAASLNALQHMGIQIAIDDFGIGHNSLDLLRRFPAHTVKIDRSFVQESTTDLQTQSIIQSVVAMTHQLNLKVIAEGVETQEQLEFLRSIQCDAAQGFLFSHPLSGECTTKLLERSTSYF